MKYQPQTKLNSANKTPRIYWLLRMVIGITFLITLIWGWRLFHNPHFMPIKNVKLTGSYQHIDQPTLSKIITPFIGDHGLFSVDVDALKQTLLQQPWVYSVLIKRVWPDQIAIAVTEQQAAALWNDNALLNTEGDEFIPNKKTFPMALPSLQGPEGQNLQVFQQLNQFNTILAPLNLKIAKLQLNSRGSWQMVLSNNIVIILGRTDAEQRLNRFVAIYPKIFADRAQDVLNVDLRYTDGVAVKWSSQSLLTKSTTPEQQSATSKN